ncbi:hypothetical protein D0T56_15600 [Dysgonomonas sp. 520]|nr:hypothetical protein [Dysgonomonas sp. 520]
MLGNRNLVFVTYMQISILQQVNKSAFLANPLYSQAMIHSWKRITKQPVNKMVNNKLAKIYYNYKSTL